MARVVLASKFQQYLANVQWQARGCFVDTNLLFAADYEVHRLYDEAVDLGETILSNKIPIFSNGLHYFPNDGKLKKYRDLFESEIGPGSWADFCSKFIGDKLQSEWEGQVERKGISYLDGRSSEYLTAPVEWSDAIKLIETYGIGTSDAMIINIFLRSVFPFIVTADSDVAYCMMNIETDKVVVVPDLLDFPGRKLD